MELERFAVRLSKGEHSFIQKLSGRPDEIAVEYASGSLGSGIHDGDGRTSKIVQESGR